MRPSCRTVSDVVREILCVAAADRRGNLPSLVDSLKLWTIFANVDGADVAAEVPAPGRGVVFAVLDEAVVALFLTALELEVVVWCVAGEGPDVGVGCFVAGGHCGLVGEDVRVVLEYCGSCLRVLRVCESCRTASGCPDVAEMNVRAFKAWMCVELVD